MNSIFLGEANHFIKKITHFDYKKYTHPKIGPVRCLYLENFEFIFRIKDAKLAER